MMESTDHHSGVHLQSLDIEVPQRRLLNDVEFQVLPGESVAIAGPSGSGKTSLMNCISGVRVPSAGDVVIAGRSLRSMSGHERDHFRLANIGMIFQFGELIPELTVAENVALPLRLLGWAKRPSFIRTAEVLEQLNLANFSADFVDSLSGGEVQRVGIARALARRPKVILADEPTGALDEDNASIVTDLLLSLAREFRAALIIATHDPVVARACDRSCRIERGRLVEKPRDDV